MSAHLITTFEIVEDESPETLPSATGDLSITRRQIEFVRRALANGYLDFDCLDELDEALAKALGELDAHEAKGARQ